MDCCLTKSCPHALKYQNAELSHRWVHGTACIIAGLYALFGIYTTIAIFWCSSYICCKRRGAQHPQPYGLVKVLSIQAAEITSHVKRQKVYIGSTYKQFYTIQVVASTWKVACISANFLKNGWNFSRNSEL